VLDHSHWEINGSRTVQMDLTEVRGSVELARYDRPGTSLTEPRPQGAVFATGAQASMVTPLTDASMLRRYTRCRNIVTVSAIGNTAARAAITAIGLSDDLDGLASTSSNSSGVNARPNASASIHTES
jgi:hypothetical protein